METKQPISDELLAKYLAGKTSPEETERVLSFLAENDENLDDFAQICAAVEVQTAAENAAFAQKMAFRRRLLWVTSSAAAVALVVVVALFALRNNPAGNDAKLVAKADTVKTTVPAPENVADSATPSVASTDAPAAGQKSGAPATNVNWSGEQKNYAGTAAKTNYCNLLAPTVNPSVVSKERAAFDFQWSSDATKQTFSLKDENGKTICQKSALDGFVKFKVSDYQGYNKLLWQLDVTYSNGKSETKRGEVRFE